MIVSTKRLASGFNAHNRCACMVLLLLLLLAVIIYYAKSGSRNHYSQLPIRRKDAAPVSISKQNQGVQNAAPVSISTQHQGVQNAAPMSISKQNQGVQNAAPMSISKQNQDVQNAAPVSTSTQHQGVQNAAPVSTAKQPQAGVKNVLYIWRPKDHPRRNFTVGKLKTPTEVTNARREAKNEMIIYLYPPPDMICDLIRRIGAWEPHIVSPLMRYLVKDPGLDFLDIGTMIGVYTLHVANLGRKVVGVEGSRENALRLGQALMDNELQDRVILVHNIIDAKYGQRVLNTFKTHVGAAYIGKEKPGGETFKNPPVDAILADDLLPLISFKRAVLKIDIENFEYEFFLKASKIFDTIDIPLVLMEYNAGRRTRQSRNFIKNFMTSRNLWPYATIESQALLGPDDTKWPFDIVWRRNEANNKIH